MKFWQVKNSIVSKHYLILVPHTIIICCLHRARSKPMVETAAVMGFQEGLTGSSVCL